MTRGKSKTATFKIGRDAKTGKFLSVKVAQRRKATAVVETIKRPVKPRRRRR